MNSLGQLPLGVAILAVLIGIFGFFVLLVGLLMIVSMGSVLGGAGVTSVFGFTGVWAGVVVAIFGLVILSVAIGLWGQDLFSLIIAIIVLIAYGVVDFDAGSWVGFVIVVTLIVYLGAVSSHFA